MSLQNKDNNDSYVIIALVAIFAIIAAIIWGNYDKKSQVLSPKMKSLLSDDDNANALLDAIEKEKSGKDKSPEFEMDGEKFTIKRSGRYQVEQV